MAENAYSFGKLPKGAYQMMGGCYYCDPRDPLPHEQREMDGGGWRLPLATGAPAKTRVRVLLDDGQIFETFTRSEPWEIGGGRWVVLLYGRTGGFALERVAPG